eukprot:5368009-Lingulodinium_polyedra.AAC.1
MDFDDAGFVDISSAKGAGQRLLRRLFSLLGSPFKSAKSVEMCQRRDFLGLVRDFVNILKDGSVGIHVREALAFK